MKPKRMAFVFGDTTMTISQDDVETIIIDWEESHPGRSVLEMTPKEFADECMKRLKASARPTRTVLHN